MNRCTPPSEPGGIEHEFTERKNILHCAVTRYVIWDLLFRAPMASWLDDLGLNELEHIKLSPGLTD